MSRQDARTPAPRSGVSGMSVSYINAELRRFVLARSKRLCEYCLLAEEDTF